MIEITKLDNPHQIEIAGNWLKWYDQETDTMIDTCPVSVEEGSLIHIDEECMIWEINNHTKVFEIDGIGNKTLVWEKERLDIN